MVAINGSKAVYIAARIDSSKTGCDTISATGLFFFVIPLDQRYFLAKDLGKIFLPKMSVFWEWWISIMHICSALCKIMQMVRVMHEKFLKASWGALTCTFLCLLLIEHCVMRLCVVKGNIKMVTTVNRIVLVCHFNHFSLLLDACTHAESTWTQNTYTNADKNISKLDLSVKLLIANRCNYTFV